ncbi:Hypothetical protein NTJ_09952 [Nesidiocoris tenuis]|uniref:Uncharacterized protein n=1 Tax=Nesidiocoris tenuis TaxID=355587 RepID=A0ABN7AY90_9HEMI|nr:Hypothetical protein NTJ_09952 [Nesidiocoris tenuis]
MRNVGRVTFARLKIGIRTEDRHVESSNNNKTLTTTRENNTTTELTTCSAENSYFEGLLNPGKVTQVISTCKHDHKLEDFVMKVSSEIKRSTSIFTTPRVFGFYGARVN